MYPDTVSIRSRIRLLLINPRFPESFWSFRFVVSQVLPDKRAVNPPLGLATLAALCPSDWDITIVDENVETIPLTPDADLVGVCGMGVQFERQVELLKLEHYTTVSMQFSRGCPFRCEFCDIIVMFGRKPHTKTTAQVGRELDALRELGVNNVFFVDDNLIGNKPKVRELLTYLAEYQRENEYRFSFGVEASLNLAEDKALIDLFQKAHIGWAFIGIESPDEAALAEMKKSQNLRGDLLESVRTLYRHGIDVMAGFIVGFDSDTLDTFERQREFIMKAGIQVAMVGLLTALPRTPLYHRLNKEGRLLEGTRGVDNTGVGTNLIPLRMDYDAMVAHYKQLYRVLQSDAGIARR